MAHDSQVHDAEDRYLGIRNRVEYFPNLTFAVMDLR
ncbi:MAG: hypothetical protein JWO04_4580 [Gammaproteobacteria bacterium]|jgi:hypothetical protein|nr:hypothetical protein [Gammaproteobacteria bacterium]